jgi:hypothetical protein
LLSPHQFAVKPAFVPGGFKRLVVFTLKMLYNRNAGIENFAIFTNLSWIFKQSVIECLNRREDEESQHKGGTKNPLTKLCDLYKVSSEL